MEPTSIKEKMEHHAERAEELLKSPMADLLLAVVHSNLALYYQQMLYREIGEDLTYRGVGR